MLWRILRTKSPVVCWAKFLDDMWEISNNSQLAGFGLSIIFGMMYSALYDIFRAIRFRKNPHTIIVVIEDIIYFAIIAVITFLFLLSVTYGEVRFYVLLGIVLGFIIFRTTISRFYLKIVIYLLKGVYLLFDYFSKGFYYFFDKIDIIFDSFFKNTLKCFKKVLKKGKGLLYTNRK